MARFRLDKPHYLNVPGTQWEQTEFDQATKRQARHLYNVHLLLDPEDPSMHNYEREAVIIVSTKADPAFPRDIVFVGPPTLDMEALDVEAEKMLDKLRSGTIHPMSEAALPTSGVPLTATPKPSAELESMRQMMAEMRGQVAMLVGQNESLQRRLDAKEEAEEEPLAEPMPEVVLTPSPNPLGLLGA